MSCQKVFKVNLFFFFFFSLFARARLKPVLRTPLPSQTREAVRLCKIVIHIGTEFVIPFFEYFGEYNNN
jgi:hypothetical protein